MTQEKSSDDPIIISSGSPLRLRIQDGGHWDPEANGFHHSQTGRTATRVSFDYVDDDRWLDRELSGPWTLTIPYGAVSVVITPGNGVAGAGLKVTGAAPGTSADLLQVPNGNFGQIKLNSESFVAPSGKLRIAIAYK